MAFSVRVACLVTVAMAAVTLSTTHLAAADWIWTSPRPQAGETAWFRKSFDLKNPGDGTLTITADNSYALYVNGRLVGLQRLTEDWSEPDSYSLVRVLRKGRNSIAVRAINDDDAAAVMVTLVGSDNGKEFVIETGADWQARRNLQPKWSDIDAHGGGWSKPHVFGKAGEVQPWGKLKPAKAIKDLIEFF